MLIDMLFTLCSIKMAQNVKNEGYKGPDSKVQGSDNGGYKEYAVLFPQNIGRYLHDYMMSHPRRL
jgi:hypothetical protein